MTTNTPEGIGNDGTLSLDEAIKAYAAVSSEEVREDQPEDDEEEVQDDAELSDEEEEVDGETADEDDAEDGESDDEPEQGRFVSDDGKVRLEDGTVITIAELKRGNLREADYTRKNQERAERERQLEAHREQLTQYEQQLAMARDITFKVLETRMPQEPDPELLMNDPIGYMQAKAAYDRGMKEYGKLQQETAQLREQQQQIEAYERHQMLAREQQALSQKIPEFSDPAKRPAFIASIVEAAKDYGISSEELGGIVDHRVIVALKDLARLKGINKAASSVVPKKTANKPPVSTGSKRLAPSEQRGREVNTALQRLNKSGSLKDGVAAYLATQRK